MTKHEITSQGQVLSDDGGGCYSNPWQVLCSCGAPFRATWLRYAIQSQERHAFAKSQEED